MPIKKYPPLLSVKKYYYLYIFIAITCLLWHACSKTETEESTLPTWNGMPYKTLAEYNFFEGTLKNLQPAAHMVRYDLCTPLFSNYAEKQRLIYIPTGQSIEYQPQKAFDFPVGSIIVKTFYYYNNTNDTTQGKQIIETRLLIKTDTEWLPATYLWNAQQTEATYTILNKAINITYTDHNNTLQTIPYIIPNRNDCKGCHAIDNVLVPIGPKARHLNKNFTYTDGNTQNQLEYWTQKGILQNTPANPATTAPHSAIWNDSTTFTLDQRARTYLDINCAHCHNQSAAANNSGLWLEAYITDSLKLGVCKIPVAAGNATGGNPYAIFPQHPEKSIMVYRLRSLKPGTSMPELARSVEHKEGTKLIEQWILSLTNPCQ